MTVRRSARKAAQVLALSEYGRSDIVKTYDINPEVVTVIPLAAPAHFAPVVDKNELQRVRKTYGIANDYFVWGLSADKNLGG